MHQAMRAPVLTILHWGEEVTQQLCTIGFPRGLAHIWNFYGMSCEINARRNAHEFAILIRQGTVCIKVVGKAGRVARNLPLGSVSKGGDSSER